MTIRFLLMLFALIISPILAKSQDTTVAKQIFTGGNNPVYISKLVTNDAGQTMFVDAEFDWKGWNYGARSSTYLPARYVEFFHFEKGLPTIFHTSTANQILIVVEGTFIVETSSGEVREFPPGTAVWETDIEPTSEGHKSRMKGGADGYGVRITIDHKKLK